jgi:hypothetical protein
MSQVMTDKTERTRYTHIAADEELTATQAVVAIVKEFARERPEVAGLWCFGIGFVLGWKLKPW